MVLLCKQTVVMAVGEPLESPVPTPPISPAATFSQPAIPKVARSESAMTLPTLHCRFLFIRASMRQQQSTLANKAQQDWVVLLRLRGIS